MNKRVSKKIQKRRGFKTYKRYKDYVYNRYWEIINQCLSSHSHISNAIYGLTPMTPEKKQEINKIYLEQATARKALIIEREELHIEYHKSFK